MNMPSEADFISAMKQMDVNIARENKNRFDVKKKEPPKKKK